MKKPDEKPECERAKPPDDDVADFFEPVTFGCDEYGYVALEAARKFSEGITADY